MPAHRPPLLTFSAVGLSLALLAGCASTPAPTPTATVGTDAPSADPSGAPEPTAAPTETSAALTCDTLIDADTVDQLQSQGWTAKETPFAAGGVTLDDGLQCTWADYDVPSGNLMLFGWAPLTADQAADMQSGLETEGWLREDTGGSVYITEDPAQAPTIDEQGYGMTYEFGDGWVIVADVKQNLLLIQRPGA